MISSATDRFHLLAEVVSLQVWTARPNGALDWANNECVQYFGADLETQILGDAWAQFVHPDDLSGALRAWQHSLVTGERYEVEFRLRRHDGADRWFLVRAQAMRDEQGAIAQWFGTNTDTHDLKTAQRGAEAASRAKDAFLAALSHELRTPLAPVLMMARSLCEDERLPADVRESLRMMERNVALEARLIDDLLDLTRIAQGQLRLRAEPCDTHSLIGLAVEIVRDDAVAKAITIERNFSAHLCGLVTDPARFQQVIWNLLRNAVKFTPRGGRISICTRNESDREGIAALRIEVTDSGIGIEENALERIFLPFEQGDVKGEHRFGGVGLGLAIVRAIVDLHDGRITARSDGMNQGATFVIELPRAIAAPQGGADSELFDQNESAGGQAQTQPAEEAVRPLKLLLVEDHEATMMVLSKLLAASGHQVTQARNVAEAVEAAGQEGFDLLISDLGLPDGSGTELMKQLRKTAPDLRGVAMSGYGMDEDVAGSLAAGFTIHLTKPVDYNQLTRALRNTCG